MLALSWWKQILLDLMALSQQWQRQASWDLGSVEGETMLHLSVQQARVWLRMALKVSLWFYLRNQQQSYFEMEDYLFIYYSIIYYYQFEILLSPNIILSMDIKQQIAQYNTKNTVLLQHIHPPPTRVYSIMGTEEYIQGMAITIIALNALSAIALIFIMSIYLSGIQRTNNFPMRLVFYLCIACLLQNIYVFIDNPITIHDESTYEGSSDAFCTFEGVLKTMADLSSIVWTTLILFSAYYSIVKEKTQEEMKNLEVWFLIGGFGVPTIIACLPLPFSLYGFDAYYCWFNTQSIQASFWLSMGFYYIPLWILFFLNIYLTTATLNRLKQLQLQEQQIKVFKRLLWYPFILLITAIFSTIHKIQQVATNDDVWLWLIILDYVFFSLYGLLNAIAYGLNPNIREIIREKICCEKRERSESRNTEELNKEILMEQLND